MRVLLLGATGNVGSRLLPALIAHKHEVVLYVRNPAKLSTKATSRALAIESGSATDSNKIKNAMLAHKCDAVINAAGLAPAFGKSPELPVIFAAVMDAALAARKERGGAPIRVWLLSGQGVMDHPRKGKTLMDLYVAPQEVVKCRVLTETNSVPIYTTHRQNYERIRSVPADQLAWSLFCANNMPPRSEAVDYNPTAGTDADNLISRVDAPPAWSNTLLWIPFLGNYLNVMAQAQGYFATLEYCTDFIARDLNAGLQSELVGHRVGVKVKAKSS